MIATPRIALLLGMLSCLAAQPAWAVLVFLKGTDQPLRGYLVRETESMVVINQLLDNHPYALFVS